MSILRVASLGVVTAFAALVGGAAAGERQPTSLFEPAVESVAHVTPSPNQVVPLGTKIEGDCRVDDGRVDGRIASWELSTVIPRFKHGGSGGEVLAPRAARLPRLANGPNPAQGPFKNEWVLEPKIVALAGSAVGGGCQVQSFDPLLALTVEQPGPYVFVQYYQTAHFTAVADTNDAPAPQPCAENDPDFPEPNSDIAPPPELDNATWVVDGFCNRTIVTGFHVASKGDCPANGNMSRWPRVSYINQYDAGAKVKLPQAASDSRRGGNACGPSALLMAMLSGGTRNLPKLPKTYDETMQATAEQIAAREAAAVRAGRDPKKVRDNRFVGLKAEGFLKSLGWRSARKRDLSANVEEMEETILKAMGGKYPIVISTAFGTNEWGVTGGGHMIAIVGADRRGNFIVEDPAGNFFATPSKHYGPGKCGHRAVYPHWWVLAYTTSRWLVELGNRSPPRRPFLSAPSVALAPDDAASLFGERASGATPRYGTAFGFFDAHPGSKDTPASFYLQDAKGRRAGWIQGRVVSQITDASVGQDPPGWTDPAIGDESLPKPGRPEPTPRGIVVAELAPGTKLFVSGKKGARYALTATSWQDGSVVASRVLSGTGTGAPALLSLSR